MGNNMMASYLNAKYAKKSCLPKNRFVSIVILTVVCVLLSLFVLPCTGAEAAAPKRKEIAGTYHTSKGDVKVLLNGNALTIAGKPCSYNPDTGTATSVKDPVAGYFVVRFSKDANGNVILSGKHYFPGYQAPKGASEFSIPASTISFSGSKRVNPNSSDQDSEKKSEQTSPVEDTDNKGNVDSDKDHGYYSDTDEDNQDDLPETDVGKAAVAVGTALGGGLAGAAGAIGGAAGGTGGGAMGGGASGAGGAAGAGGGYGGHSGSNSLNKDDYGPDDYNDSGDRDYNDSVDGDYDDSVDGASARSSTTTPIMLPTS